MPPLCDDDLVITQHTVEGLKDIPITYWKYTPSVLDDTKHPILAVNGGPGLPHNYLRPARNLACDGRQVVLYDQAGTGASQFDLEWAAADDADDEARLVQKYPELFTLEYYALVELPAVLRDLGWTRYHILGESWGTQIAFHFAAHGQDISGLQSLMMNAPIADNHRFIDYQWDPVDGTLGTLPTYLQEQLMSFNETRDFENGEFLQLQEVVEDMFNARIGVVVDCWLDTEEAGISSMSYDALTGVTDIFYPNVGVNMKGWTVLDKLHRLRNVPVQLNHGQYDMVRPRLVAETAQALMQVECHLLPRAAHSILLDSPVEVYGYMQDFLVRVERGDNNFDRSSCFPVLKAQQSESMVAVMLTGVAVLLGAFLAGARFGRRQNQPSRHGYEEIKAASVEME
jgi:proline-specific peptidase